MRRPPLRGEPARPPLPLLAACRIRPQGQSGRLQRHAASSPHAFPLLFGTMQTPAAIADMSAECQKGLHCTSLSSEALLTRIVTSAEGAHRQPAQGGAAPEQPTGDGMDHRSSQATSHHLARCFFRCCAAIFLCREGAYRVLLDQCLGPCKKLTLPAAAPDRFAMIIMPAQVSF